MIRLAGALRWLGGWFGRGRRERELADELAFHLEMATEQNIARGMSAAEARRAALVAFGGVERHAEGCRDARRTRWLEARWSDLRLGARTLWRSPGYTAAAALTLALGIGASTAVFTVVNGVVLRPLAYPGSDRLYVLYEQDAPGSRRLASYPTFQDWREGAGAFESMAYMRGDALLVRGDAGAERLLAGFVSPDFFRVFETPAELGRTLGPEDARGAPVVVISHRLWRTRYGGAPSVLGRPLATPQGTFTIVGVMPAGFEYPADWRLDLWLPDALIPPTGRHYLTRRDLHVDSRVVARLRPEASVGRAMAQLSGVARRLAAAYPAENGTVAKVELVPVRDEVLGDVEPVVLALSLSVALVLLIACANVASLTLARGSARMRELAVRSALGAGRRRLAAHLLAEGILVAGLGGGVGVLLARGAIEALRARAPEALPRLAEATVDARVLAFALAICVATVLLFALVPALRASSASPARALATGARGGGEDLGTGRLRGALVVAEVTLALVLLVNASLLLKSLWKIGDVALGFEPEHAVAIRIFPPSPRYDSPGAAEALYSRILEAARAVPGVEAAALVNHVPSGGFMPTPVVAGALDPSATAAPPVDEGDYALFRTVSDGYFRALGTPVVRGRGLDAADVAANRGGIVANEAFAKRFFPGGDALGRTVTIFKQAQGRADFGRPMTAQVVGIARNERAFGPEGAEVPVVYVPRSWNPWQTMYLVARTTGDPMRVVPALRRMLLDIDPDIPVNGPGNQARFVALREYVSGTLAARRLDTGLLTVFAGTALLLSLVGVFGLIAYLVVRRTREIGVRIALGARPTQVRALIVGHAARLVGLGVVLGVAGAVAASTVLERLLFGIGHTDPWTYAATVAGFVAAAVLAAYVPARRATRIEPSTALRAE